MNNSFAVTEINRNFRTGYKLKRDCFSQISDYITSEQHQSRICAIYGIRRTGKTTLLQQAVELLKPEEKNKALFIECFDGSDFYDLINFINTKIQNGYKYFFIDEITFADGFVQIGNILANKFVNLNGAKIVVTATDSLALSLASKDKMYDRIQFVNTTHISFAEYSRITGIRTIDEFIRKGSTLRTDIFDTKKSTDDFIETAIVNNIIHSLKKSEDSNRRTSTLTEKYSEDAIRCEIQRIINRYSQVRTYSAIRKLFKSTPLGDARDTILQHMDDGFDIINNLDYKKTNEKIAQILGCDRISGIKDADIDKLYEYMCEIGVFESIPVYSSYTRQEYDEPLHMVKHPGMFHANILYTLRCLNEDDSWINANEHDKKTVLQKAYESAVGKIMENVIISDIYHLLCNGEKKVFDKDNIFDTGRWYVSKLNATLDGKKVEADVIIYDKKKNESCLFEIKHSSENVKQQSKYLEDDAFVEYVEKEFGTVKGKAVLYNGDVDISGTVPRIPADMFLRELYYSHEEPDFSVNDVLSSICDSAEELWEPEECESADDPEL